MRKIFCFFITILLVISASAMPVYAEDNTLYISSSNINHEVSPNLYGITLEDSSFGIDGGLASELVNNGSFEYEANPEVAWDFDGVDPILSNSDPINESNKSYEELKINSNGAVTNLGFTAMLTKNGSYDEDGAKKPNMGFKEGVAYDFSCYIKNIDFEGSISVCLDSKSNKNNLVKLSAATISTYQWTKLTAKLESNATELGGLTINFKGNGSLQLDMVSLVPQDSHGNGIEQWKYTSVQPELFDALKMLKPSFVRFPGGCNAEGRELAKQNSWKNTIGDPVSRIQVPNTWTNDDNGYNYNNSNNMGYHEYFQLCEDLGATAVPVVSAGIICQDKADFEMYQIANKKAGMSNSEWSSYLINERGYDEKDEKGMDEFTSKINALKITSSTDYEAYLDTIALRPFTAEFKNYTQDILDLIEYANGDAETTYWGALRSANGHTEPFNIKFIQVGSDNWGDVYWRNFAEINSAIKNAYPDVTVIACAPSDGEASDEAWGIANGSYANDYVDEHIIDDDDFFSTHNDKYDSFDRDGAGACVFEYAYSGENNMWSAVNEASFITGMERNSDVVKMSSYANTLARVNANSKNNSLVWFDSNDIAFTPNYYTQMLFSNNTGTNYIETSLDNEKLYQSVTVDENKQVVYVKLANLSSNSQKVAISLDGFDAINYASCQSVSNGYKSAANEIDKQRVAPTDTELKASKNSLSVTVDGYSASVVRIAYGKSGVEALYSLPTDLDLSTKKFIPPAIKVIAAALCVSIPIGGVAGYMLYTKAISKKKKGRGNKKNEE